MLLPPSDNAIRLGLVKGATPVLSFATLQPAAASEGRGQLPVGLNRIHRGRLGEGGIRPVPDTMGSRFRGNDGGGVPAFAGMTVEGAALAGMTVEGFPLSRE